MRTPALFLAFLLATGGVNAQTAVSGTVKDGKGHPIRGASVTIKDSYDGATVDSLGNFRFQTAEKGAFTLVTTNIGYNPVEEPITLDGTPVQLHIVLKEQLSELKAVTITAEYMVGCDGGSSTVRKQLDFKMDGEPHLREMRQALFHCPELYDKVKAPRARHYNRIDDHWTLMIVQDSRQHFTIHAIVDKDEDMATLFEKTVGTPVRYEMLHCAKWVQRLFLAEH